MSTAARKIRLLMLLRRNGVSDTGVLRAIEMIPREVFVPPTFHDQAYEDTALPIGHGQTISQPLVVGLMTQVLDLHDRLRVLEIGTGSGYQAAVLSRIVRRVYTIERHRPLLMEAERRFNTLRLHNITARLGDGMRGWPEAAPFERILVTAGGGAEPPADLVKQLAVGGVMVIPLGPDRREQRVVRLRRTESGLAREDLWPVRFVPLLPDVAPEAPRAERAS
ncbi:protein-L-isoaspartate(D-aspartate) O-methyltransferase [Rhodospirillum centenum]|uniref:Protein-L-isoaspartate O-methyltransferase n=1 Tax=Rhodospirillum centenum (strain ATCC 51521 / SW) TaxID=414684 RepID=PIMT_RHOCS|nr:protein-L-isoaspartate(D-aspartate) O-methyltransferase [Rhodospirillum centenum]B6ISM3.1 RecName: Full=Protein-L-isoaspartate O-methyltransferase; AltName: Full=L-isoaspartyl protein carboxyl methyltransferase; AltName: Full=Protein L-isoaspartyl methyltransferase; AltName: Full=Protein-beta-aspartate methyltransferase; Short=PIMT [Rhodospirillum centenum SW]ACI98459.1 protein-L-isoaspartate O-methyltransferase, putative [Rhodospirillum centenum SW]